MYSVLSNRLIADLLDENDKPDMTPNGMFFDVSVLSNKWGFFLTQHMFNFN